MTKQLSPVPFHLYTVEILTPILLPLVDILLYPVSLRSCVILLNIHSVFLVNAFFLLFPSFPLLFIPDRLVLGGKGGEGCVCSGKQYAHTRSSIFTLL